MLLQPRLFPSLSMVAALLVSSGGCSAPDVGPSCTIHREGTEPEQLQALQRCSEKVSQDIVDPRLYREVDVLFVIDNSPSMGPKQRALAQALPDFFRRLNNGRNALHIAVVTTDVGTLPIGAASFPGGASLGCDTATGDDGLFQRRACVEKLATGDQTSEAAQACRFGLAPSCPDPSFVPEGGFIDLYGPRVNVSPQNAGTLTSDEIAGRALSCIALVGDRGCRISSPLEAMRRALDGRHTQNQGFLRPGSKLVVVFITDKDDYSYLLSERFQLDPGSMACPASSTDPRCFNLDFRGLASSLICDEPMATLGPKHNCRPRPDNPLEPVRAYVEFLSQLRPSNRLVVIGLWPPALINYQAPEAVGPGRVEVESQLAENLESNQLRPGTRERAACFLADSSLTNSPFGLAGQPQVRLSSFIRSFDPSVYVEQSICNPSRYAAALDAVGEYVHPRFPTCLSVRPRKQAGEPLCLVGYVPESTPTALPAQFLPSCSARCCDAWANASEPIASNGVIRTACTHEPADCYCAVPSAGSDGIPRCQDTAVAGVWVAGDRPPPEGHVVNFRCAGVAPVQY